MHISTGNGSASDLWGTNFPTPCISPDVGSLMVSFEKVCALHALANKKDKLWQSSDLNDPSQFIRFTHCGQQIAWRVIKPLSNQAMLTVGAGRAWEVHPPQTKVNVHIKG